MPSPLHRRNHARLSLLALLTAASACVPRAVPPPAPAPAVPVPAPSPPPAPVARDWQDWPVTPGTWRYDRDARGSRASFGPGGAGAMAALRCDFAARALYLSRAGGVAGPATIRTSALTRTLTMQLAGGEVTASLAPRDTLLDAIAFSRGRFTIEQPGVAPLVLPPWSEVARVIEDCRG